MIHSAPSQSRVWTTTLHQLLPPRLACSRDREEATVVVRMYTGPHARRVSPLMRGLPLASLVFALATIASQMAWVWAADRFLLTNVVVISCALAAVATLCARNGFGRGLLTAVTIAVLGWLIEILGVHTGWPFGRYMYLDVVGQDHITGSVGHSVPMVAGVPAIVPLAWLMMTVPVYYTTQMIKASLLSRLLWGVLALVGWDFFLDPQFVSEGWWHWADASRHIRGLPGIPISNYIGWIFAASVLITAMWLATTIDAQPNRGSRSRLSTTVPVIVYIWTWAGGIFSNLVFFDRPASALWGGVVMGWPLVALIGSWLLHKREHGRGALRDSRPWT